MGVVPCGCQRSYKDQGVVVVVVAVQKGNERGGSRGCGQEPRKEKKSVVFGDYREDRDDR